MKFKSDIDIDFGNRDIALSLVDHTPAGIMRDGVLVKHNTGIYPTDIPIDPYSGIASLDFNVAEDRGYTKLDFLNDEDIYPLVLYQYNKDSHFS